MTKNNELRLGDCKVYCILRGTDKQLPSKKKDAERKVQLVALRRIFPFVIRQEIQNSDSFKLSFLNQFFNGDNYSFKRRQDRKVGIQWKDYSVQLLPMLLALKRIDLEKSISDLVHALILEVEHSNNNRCSIELNWKWLIEFVENYRIQSFTERIGQSDINLMDLIDKFYDEVKMTHLHPASYYLLFEWFGEATVDIGYNAFDLYNQSRDSKMAWEKAIKNHMVIYNLDDSLFNYIFNERICKLLEFY
ncbi:hypothetical protein [Carboxylicivirga caseinilyticus]|uniref:hypothetical protein n=1 Tax=Carboxylicivirga caseinilyticus TaxID=3417572 RepID=UPI003D32B717|nr:hypothetical protein [Marinilabiliaceae bacterium A049]